MDAPAPSEIADRVRPSLAGSRLLLACTGLAALSLFLPAALGFDPWAWLVWGREVPRLDLDTTGGPSWKPLPVLLTTMLAPLGAAAVPVFMVLMRTAALLAVAGVHRLATRLGGPAAGAVAVLLLIVTPDGDPRFLRLLGEGHVAPLGAACVVWVIEWHLGGRFTRALGAAWALALLRPEAWPFVILHAAWLQRREPARRPFLLGAIVSIPVLWFAGDWWGAGDPFHGADAAQVLAEESPFQRLLDALGVAGAMVPLPAWIAAGLAVVLARRRRSLAEQWLAVGALAWSVLVIAMAAVLGYAALSRFFLPAAAVVCVLAGVGVVRAAALLRTHDRAWVTAAAVILALASLGLVAPRAAGVGPVLAEVAQRSGVEDDLDRVLTRAGGRDALAACGEVAVAGRGLLRSAVAWKLDLPMHRVGLDLPDKTGTMLLRAGSRRDRIISASPVAVTLARGSEWVAFAVRCPDAVPTS